MKHIDFWSLDVEGAELAVLKALDFSQVTVDVIVAETSGDDPAKDEAVCAILANNGFVAVEHSNKDTLLNKMVRRCSHLLPSTGACGCEAASCLKLHPLHLPRRTPSLCIAASCGSAATVPALPSSRLEASLCCYACDLSASSSSDLCNGPNMLAATCAACLLHVVIYSCQACSSRPASGPADCCCQLICLRLFCAIFISAPSSHQHVAHHH